MVSITSVDWKMCDHLHFYLKWKQRHFVFMWEGKSTLNNFLLSKQIIKQVELSKYSYKMMLTHSWISNLLKIMNVKYKQGECYKKCRKKPTKTQGALLKETSRVVYPLNKYICEYIFTYKYNLFYKYINIKYIL